MYRRVFSVLLLLLATTAFAACDDMSTTPTAAPMTNSELENQIKAKLNSDQQLRSANLSVTADAAKNEASLSGTVDSAALRNRAVEMAKSARSGLMITDKIEVKPREVSRAEYTEEQAMSEREKAKGFRETVGDSLDDAWIHMKIVTKLIGDADTPERKINVDVVDNMVTLRGTVDTAEQKAEAGRIASETDGVRSVKNQLKVAARTKSV
jgi:osmotically-inducible protein OsmY